MQNEGKERLHLVNPTREQVIDALTLEEFNFERKPNTFRIKVGDLCYYYALIADSGPIIHEGSKPCVIKIENALVYVVDLDGRYEYRTSKTTLFIDQITEVVELKEREYDNVRSTCDALENRLAEFEKTLKRSSEYHIVNHAY